MNERAPRLGPLDRLRAWVVTGAPGRVAALLIELAAALGRGIRRAGGRLRR
jgi:hypothetical protein